MEIPLQYNGRSLLCGGRWRPVRTLFPFLFLFLGERRTGRRGKTGEGIGEFSIVTKRAQEKGRNTFDPPHMWVNTKRLSLRGGENKISHLHSLFCCWNILKLFTIESKNSDNHGNLAGERWQCLHFLD